MPISILDTVRLELTPTATYARRECVWVPGSDGSDHRDGTLTINLQHGRKSSAKLETDTYALQATPRQSWHPPAARVWLLVNLTDPAADQVYETTIAARPDDDRCTCKAAECKAPGCKHRDSLRDLLEHGAFDDLDVPAPPPEPKRDWSRFSADTI